MTKQQEIRKEILLHKTEMHRLDNSGKTRQRLAQLLRERKIAMNIIKGCLRCGHRTCVCAEGQAKNSHCIQGACQLQELQAEIKRLKKDHAEFLQSIGFQP